MTARLLPYAGADYAPGAARPAPRDPLADNLRAQLVLLDRRIAGLQDERARLQGRLLQVETTYAREMRSHHE